LLLFSRTLVSLLAVMDAMGRGYPLSICILCLDRTGRTRSTWLAV
jgi:hypothetical protein